MKSQISTTASGLHVNAAKQALTYRSTFLKAVIVLIAIALVTLAATRFLQPAHQANAKPVAPILRPYDATGAMQKAIVLPGETHSAAAPNIVYDATGAMQKTIVLPGETHSAAAPNIVYDATDAMQKAIVLPGETHSAATPNIVYDATAAMLQSVVYPKSK